MIKLSLKSVSYSVLRCYLIFSILVLNKLDIDFSYIVFPNKKSKISLLKSPHVYKKHKDHFEVKIYKAVFYLKDCYALRPIIKILIFNKPKSICFSLFLER